MIAADVLAGLRRHYHDAALVPEVVVSDFYAEWGAETFGDVPIRTRRIDVLMFHRQQRTAIEIKVSRDDAARESWRKVWPFMAIVHRFVYAVPAGLIDRPPVSGCGLLWVHPDGLVEVKGKAKVNHSPEPLPQHVVQALAYRAAGRSEAPDTEAQP